MQCKLYKQVTKYNDYCLQGIHCSPLSTVVLVSQHIYVVSTKSDSGPSPWPDLKISNPVQP